MYLYIIYIKVCNSHNSVFFQLQAQQYFLVSQYNVTPLDLLVLVRRKCQITYPFDEDHFHYYIKFILFIPPFVLQFKACSLAVTIVGMFIYLFITDTKAKIAYLFVFSSGIGLLLYRTISP